MRRGEGCRSVAAIATAACSENPSDHARPGSVPRAIENAREQA